jgi:diaminohydroxyphosphoribosylaminopyrimidine deaminase/5-amino-6-(5-phosphoribosylamino)uracil reductase
MDDRTRGHDAQDEHWMRLAMTHAVSARRWSSPNPWVGAVVVSDGELVGVGSTRPVGGHHAEVVALEAAGRRASGSTVYVTLEPCAHHGRTPPCTEALVASGVARVVVGVLDPDPRVAGRGVALLRAAGVAVDRSTEAVATAVAEQLAPYLHHRRTGRPYVVCKLAATLDGGTAAPDGTSRWITGASARRDAHRLRAESDAVVVGAGTVRADDPALTVRHVEGRDPRRVVLGSAPAGAAVHPCLEWARSRGDLGALLDHLGAEGVVQVLVEGGAAVVRSFHDAGLVDRYVLYLAPALFGGRDATPVLAGATAPTITELWRGRLVGAEPVGGDLRVEFVPDRTATPEPGTAEPDDPSATPERNTPTPTRRSPMTTAPDHSTQRGES